MEYVSIKLYISIIALGVSFVSSKNSTGIKISALQLARLNFLNLQLEKEQRKNVTVVTFRTGSSVQSPLQLILSM